MNDSRPDTSAATPESETDEEGLIAQRRAKLDALRDQGNPFPNDFRRDALAADLLAAHADTAAEDLDSEGREVRVAGRMVSRRVMGKASFCHLQDMSGRIQAYLRRDDLPEGVYAAFKQWDVGDILGVRGRLFRTRTGELSVHAEELRLLTKSLRPLPEKWHGLADQETRYRQRYLDLISNPETRTAFAVRSQVVAALRAYFLARGFVEVETPMMQVLAGGATARPFVTHHNALGMDLYLRIAPELYLKRLVVGGFEKVFEINRNFRNEGLSTRHNPEFTMLEFYQAYADYHDLMDLTEDLVRSLVREVRGGTELTWQGETHDFGQSFARHTLLEAIVAYNEGVTLEELTDDERLRAVAGRLEVPVPPKAGTGKVQLEIFEKTVENRLRAPTFITAYPAEVSPLARRNDDDPTVADRFEFFVGGREIANGFSELNDPEEQANRFRAQAEAKAAGDAEAMLYDADYITALEHGLPPTAGEGIGVDRLVMLFTDAASIRDVILFPHLKPRE